MNPPERHTPRFKSLAGTIKNNNMDTPYEYYDNKLGVKISFLISDVDGNKERHPMSIGVITYDALVKRLRRKSSCETRLRRASLNMEALILFSSLSRDWKDALTTRFGSPKKEVKKSWFAQHYETDRAAYEFYVAHRYGKDKERKLDLKLVEEYTYNASVLNTVLEMRTSRKAYARALGVVSLDMWQSLSNDVNAFREVPHTLPATKDGLRRKTNTYAKGGYLSLVSGRLQNSNAKKVYKKEQMALLDELIYKHTNLDSEMIATIYNAVSEKMDWKPITPQTVSNRKKKKNLVSHAARHGVKSLKNNLLMQVKRRPPNVPMLYWTLDGWDVELMYQETVVDKKGNRKTTYHNRLNIVLVLDAFNKYPIGYAIGTHETPELIKKALQNAMRHTKELLGDFHMPHQLQSDNYSMSSLRSFYQSMAPIFIPAAVGNAKAKVVERYFKHINEKYFKMYDNWSGHNVSSGSKNQPNSEYLQKIKKRFPDQRGCIAQIESVIRAERAKKQHEYLTKWTDIKEEHRHLISLESYLLTLGSNTGHTNRLTGEGVKMTIEGEKYWYDSFDINFRHQAHQDWVVNYDTNDLSQVLAVSPDGSERFILEQKYIQPMALAERVPGDAEQLQRVQVHNKESLEMIVQERYNNAMVMETFLEDPRLKDTMAKHLLTDSLGQHKNYKSQERLQAAKTAAIITQRVTVKTEKKVAKTFADEQMEYYKEKVNINEYL